MTYCARMGLAQKYFSLLLDRLSGIWVNFISDSHFLSWRLLGSALGFAALLAIWRNRGFSRPWKSLRRHLRSRRFRRSLREDSAFYAVKMLFDPVWIILLGFSVSRADTMATAGVRHLLRELQWFPLATLPPAVGALLLGTVAFLAADFAAYFSHRCSHRYEILWRLHYVHHSARYLTPLTKYRIHPVQYLTDSVLRAVCIALSVGVLGAAFELKLGSTAKTTTYIFLFLTYSAIGNLRHSHFWICYGPRWSRWFCSPAMHQIHHSSRSEHLNKNFGVGLSIWDRMGGTLYIPKRRERFPIGVTQRNEAPPSLFQQTIRPFFIWKKFE